MCAVVVVASCFLSFKKEERNTSWCGNSFLDEFISLCGNVLKYSNETTSIETDLFPP